MRGPVGRRRRSRARAWQAAIAACSVYGPSAPPSASARSSAARPRRISSWSQRARSWSSSRTGSPVGPDARAQRARPGSPSARRRPCTSGSSRRQLGEDAAEPQRVLAQRRAHPVVAGGRRVALVEDQVDDLEHRRRAARRSSSPRGTSNGTCASASVRLARTMRCAIVGSGTRNARAISSVVRPPSSRSVSATRASVDSTGWQAVNISRSRSSPTSSSSAASRSGASRCCATSSSRPSSLVLALEQLARGAAGRSRGAWRWPSARRPGCPGRPTPATARARRPARPAPAPRRGRRRARSAPARRSAAADSIRQTASIVRCVVVTGALARFHAAWTSGPWSSIS